MYSSLILLKKYIVIFEYLQLSYQKLDQIFLRIWIGQKIISHELKFNIIFIFTTVYKRTCTYQRPGKSFAKSLHKGQTL